MEAAREIWRLFLRQYAPVLEFLEESYPEFWAEINDVQETIRGLTTTTRGAVVREFPGTRERETQTEMSQAHGEIYLRPPVRHFGQSVRIVEAETDRASQADLTPRERVVLDSRYREPGRRRTTDRASSPRPQRRRVDRATSPYLPDRAGSTDSRRVEPAAETTGHRTRDGEAFARLLELRRAAPLYGLSPPAAARLLLWVRTGGSDGQDLPPMWASL
ncbi:6 protein [Lasius niger]|uniref:6 protein n=1 Tax=Lasius niger TaxID=67767 RepID=A0A0J7MSV0_LASNI|nr:6 protein [Lasius niger]